MAEQKERARAARTKVSARIATPDTTKLKSESMTTEDTDGDTEILLWERTDRPYSQLLMVKYYGYFENNPFMRKAADRLEIAVYWKEIAALFP